MRYLFGAPLALAWLYFIVHQVREALAGWISWGATIGSVAIYAGFFWLIWMGFRWGIRKTEARDRARVDCLLTASLQPTHPIFTKPCRLSGGNTAGSKPGLEIWFDTEAAPRFFRIRLSQPSNRPPVADLDTPADVALIDDGDLWLLLEEKLVIFVAKGQRKDKSPLA